MNAGRMLGCVFLLLLGVMPAAFGQEKSPKSGAASAGAAGAAARGAGPKDTGGTRSTTSTIENAAVVAAGLFAVTWKSSTASNH